MWFQIKVKFLKKTEQGLIKPVTEQYLVDAVSFSEAEARITAELADNQREVTMMTITKTKIRETVPYGDTELWHKAKVTYIVADEDTEKEKKFMTYILVNSENVHEAYERCQEHLKEMLVPFRIPQIQESPIVEVYPYLAGFKASLRRPTEEEDFAEKVDQAFGGVGDRYDPVTGAPGMINPSSLGNEPDFMEHPPY